MSNDANQGPNPQATPEARAVRIKRLRNLANLSRKEIAEKYDININTLKGWELARHGGLTEKGAKNLFYILEKEGVKCTLDWILYGIGEGPKIFEKFNALAITLSNTTETTKASIDSEEKHIIEEILLFHQHNKNAIEYLVSDDSMMPCFEKGDYVAGVKRFGENIASVIGFNCIVQTKDGETLLRNLRAGSSKEVYTLLCSNLQSNLKDLVMYDVNLVSAAPVIWQRRNNPS